MGRDIVEEEQLGKKRAGYGQAVLKTLSEKLRLKYGKGFGVDTLENIRKFYLVYQDITFTPISETVLRELAETQLPSNSEAVYPTLETLDFPHNLSWSHYILLIKVKRLEVRKFYTLEASKNNWSTRELKRQIGSLLFDRLSSSRDESEVLSLASQGQEVNSPGDALKEPLVLEFLGLPERHYHVESPCCVNTHLAQYMVWRFKSIYRICN